MIKSESDEAAKAIYKKSQYFKIEQDEFFRVVKRLRIFI